jgi:glucose/arabinose dehydrogenase
LRFPAQNAIRLDRNENWGSSDGGAPTASSTCTSGDRTVTLAFGCAAGLPYLDAAPILRTLDVAPVIRLHVPVVHLQRQLAAAPATSTSRSLGTARRLALASNTARILTLALAAVTICGANPGSAATSGTCAGDCNHNNQVTVDEVLTGVGMALDDVQLDSCPELDADGNGHILVDDVVTAVNNAVRGCPATPAPTTSGAPTATPTPSATPSPTGPAHFCDLSGSMQMTAEGPVVLPGGPANAPDLRFLNLPVGFCAHFYANVGNARQLRFAPGGELFVASPTTGTTGGGIGGKAAIVVLADDDHDGTAEVASTFLGGLPSTQGLLFTSGYLYYQDGTRIMRVPYAAGQRTAAGNSEQVADITIYTSSLHWPKTLDAADDGTIYVANGGDQGEPCDPTHPFHGGILTLDGSAGGSPVAKGFRNPISVRCPHGHNLCYAVELSKDFTGLRGGREKIVPIRPGDDWGFPCCATKDVPYPDLSPVPDCSGVAADVNSFTIGDTPFDIDYETGKWPAPWNTRAYVPLHGAYGTWVGARIVAIEMDPLTGELLPGSDLGGPSRGSFLDFATGWADGSNLHGRPANVAFAPDGRLFLGNDNSGDIIWIAPLDL